MRRGKYSTSLKDMNTDDNVKTPKGDALRHITNLGEAGTFFALSLGLGLATVYFRQLEIVLAIVYVITIIYTVVSFEGNPRATFFRFSAITLGVIVGVRELLLFFWVPVVTVTVAVIALGIMGFMAYRFLELMLSPQGVRR